MSDTHNTAAAVPAARPPLLGRLLAGPRALLAWLLKNPVRGALFGALGLVAVIGLGSAATLLFPKAKAAPSAEIALQHWDEQDYEEARRIAAEVRTRIQSSYEDVGAAYFVLGGVMASEAEAHVQPDEQKTLFLIAARYLEESRKRGFPEGRDPAGLLLLGKCLQRSGRYENSLPILREAASVNPGALPEIQRLLAEGYLELEKPLLPKAMEQVQQLLATPHLPAADAHAAWLLKSRIHVRQENFTAAREALAQIPDTSSIYPISVLVDVQLLDREAAAALRSGKAKPDQFQHQFQQALDMLLTLEGRGVQEHSERAKTQFLIGVCHLRLEDTTAALAQFDRVRKAFFGSPEALAAAVYAADTLLIAQKPAEALLLYKRAITDAGPREDFHNIWLPITEFEARLQAAFDQFLASRDYARGVELAFALPPLISETRSYELRAKAQRAWAEQMLNEARGDSITAGLTASSLARGHLREAGESLERLAEARVATRHHLDDLLASGTAYLQGQGYQRAANVFRYFLRQEPRQGEPEALAGLGEALLALNRKEEALDHLLLCCDKFPRHPATYRARLFASAAYLEMGKLAEAENLLTDNLYKFSLTPQSREWRESLFALGNLNFRQAGEQDAASRNLSAEDATAETRKGVLRALDQSRASYQKAIRALSEAVARYPQAPQVVEARFQISEAYRQSAKADRKRADLAVIETARSEFISQMNGELQAALDEYAALIELLNDESSTASRGPVEQSILRNSYFGRADVLYELARYEQALQAYSAASNRYQHEPEALEAYVQIASCYRRLNRQSDARGTLEQARVVLDRIRKDVDFRRTTPYTREEWGQVLKLLADL